MKCRLEFNTEHEIICKTRNLRLNQILQKQAYRHRIGITGFKKYNLKLKHYTYPKSLKQRILGNICRYGNRIHTYCYGNSFDLNCTVYISAPYSLLEIYSRFVGGCCIRHHRPCDGGGKHL
jgi:hypothetical protein